MPSHRTEWPDAWSTFKPGMLLAVEPMIAIGSSDISTKAKSWPIFSADGSTSVHYEADVLITEDGARDLTEGLERLPIVIG